MPLGRKPLVEHLGELRTRILRYLFFLTIASGIGFLLAPNIISLLSPPEGMLVVLGPLDAFFIRFYLSLLLGFLFSFPAMLVELYGFIRPALRPGENRLVMGLGLAILILFLSGASLAFFLLPTTLQMLLSFAGNDMQPMMAADRYLGFIFWFLMIFGISFELPILLLALIRLGFLHSEDLRKSRRFAFLVIIIFAAVITPTQDVFTLTLLSVPLYVLFEATLWIARWSGMERKS